MSAMDAVVWVFALLVCAGVLYFIFTNEGATQTNALPSLELISPPSARANQPVTVSVLVHASIGSTVQVKTDTQTHQFTCQSDPCSFDATFLFTSPGKKTIDAQVGALNVSKTLDVTLNSAVCIDGTIEGECSSALPLRCMNATLVSDCSICGCPSSQLCTEGVCTNPPLSLSIASVSFPEKIYSTSVTPVSVTLTNNSESTITGLFLMIVDEYTGTTKTTENAQQVQLQSWSSGTNQTVSTHIVFSSSTNRVHVRVYDSPSTYPQSTLLTQTSEPIFITVNVDTTPPAGVGELTYVQEGDVYSLEWTASPSVDVEKYIVYQENFASGAFTTYSTFGETTQTSFALPVSSSPLAYVVRAIDGAGNPSDPSQPVVVPAS